jgi:hypothetical protein
LRFLVKQHRSDSADSAVTKLGSQIVGESAVTSDENVLKFRGPISVGLISSVAKVARDHRYGKQTMRISVVFLDRYGMRIYK